VYPACFVGAEAVDWFVKKLKLASREGGVEFGQTLIDRSIIHHVNFGETFADKGTSFYKFYQDDKNFESVTEKKKQFAAKIFTAAEAEKEKKRDAREEILIRFVNTIFIHLYFTLNFCITNNC